jgi:hypothetical protein
VAHVGKKSDWIARAFPSRGPWLDSVLCCPAASSLTMASSEPLAASCRLMSSTTGLCHTASRERFPNLLRSSLPFVPSLVPRRTKRLRLAVASPLAWTFAVLAWARHPQFCALRFQRGCVTRLNRVRCCYGPMGLLALHRPGRLRSSFHLPSHLDEASNIATRVDSQFPRPDLHRQDA